MNAAESPDASVTGDGLRLAVGTLTALPVPPPHAIDPTRARTAMLLAPAVALLPGAAAAGVALAALLLGLGRPVTAVLAVGTLALATRGLHLDGLADTADGLAASYDRERALEVMRRGDAGPAGVATLVLVLALQAAALAQALGSVGPPAVLVAVSAGRAVLPVVCARGVPAARPGGLGAAVVGSVPRGPATGVVLLTALAGALLTAVAPRWPPAAQLPPLQGGPGEDQGLLCATSAPAASALLPGALAVAAAVLVAGLLARRAVRRFGGVTGDVLGACVEAGTTAALVVLAAVPFR